MAKAEMIGSSFSCAMKLAYSANTRHSIGACFLAAAVEYSRIIWTFKGVPVGGIAYWLLGQFSLMFSCPAVLDRQAQFNHSSLDA